MEVQTSIVALSVSADPLKKNFLIIILIRLNTCLRHTADGHVIRGSLTPPGQTRYPCRLQDGNVSPAAQRGGATFHQEKIHHLQGGTGLCETLKTCRPAQTLPRVCSAADFDHAHSCHVLHDPREV